MFLENEHGAKINYRIEKNVDAATDVLAPDNAFAQALIGAKLGDKRDSPAGAGQAATWTVKEIKHKYLDLFHRVMESHTTVFPSSRALGTFHIEPEKEGGFEPIFERVRARAKLADEMGEFYQKNVIPIDAVARALGLDPIDASLGLRGRLNIRLDTCVGAEDERRTAIQHLAGAEFVMVDPLTLAIWDEIGLLEILATPNAPKVEMTQSTIDVISARAQEAADAVGRGGGSLEARGEQVVLHESTEEEQKQIVKLWSDLAAWCHEHATIVPTEVSEALQGGEVSSCSPMPASTRWQLRQRGSAGSFAMTEGCDLSAIPSVPQSPAGHSHSLPRSLKPERYRASGPPKFARNFPAARSASFRLALTILWRPMV